MSKQEEIREALGRDIGFGIVKDVPTDEIVDTVLRSLHSQGVVIKVDRELPENPFEEGGSFKESGCGAFDGVCIGQEDMLNAGYVAVESLQEA